VSASVGGKPLVRLAGVSCTYDGSPVLRGVDLQIDEGQFTGVVGPSGAGKTTLLRCLLGTVRPAAGSVARRPDLRIGYVPQVDTVDWSFPLTVAECVLMARTAGRRRPWASGPERAAAEAVLDRLGLGGLGRRHISELSGGQQQRVFIARALLGEPQLLLMDEPTAGVDVRTRHDVLHLLGDLHAAGLTVVVTTHDLNGIAAHLPHLVCLNRSVVGAGAPREVLTPDVLEQTYGARMEILEHLGIPVVLDQRLRHEHRHREERP
jgi:ABC-type Mn2+/Zn2+ transport system ATPase subunit